ncbi:hypothetical protein HY413_00020 [Candidatus Kaiserbacteria bacterium]|nr:hypothetical protein [Candidatus Kaiserbacteria bacterium]
MTPTRGFLPPNDPLTRLNPAFRELEDLAAELPALLAAKQLRPRLEKLHLPDMRYLYDGEYERAHMLAAFLVHGCIWENWQDNIVVPIIPESIARFIVEVSKKTGHPPVLSYVSYALHNWRRINPKGPIELGNIALMQYFLGGLDEAWFTLVHVAMEAQAGRAIFAAVRAQEAAMAGNADECEMHLSTLHAALMSVNAVFWRMPERCDPYIYFNRVRPWIHGWKTTVEDSPVFHGVMYEGVAEYGGKPQKFRGETGAQSSIMPLLDAALGVVHKPSMLSEHLLEMHEYMPKGHSALITAVEGRPAMRQYAAHHVDLHDVFNYCVSELWAFRKKHLEYAATYIYGQDAGDDANPTAVGTGGTSFMTSLKKHLDETDRAKV